MIRVDTTQEYREATEASTTVNEREQPVIHASGRRIASVADLVELSARAHDCRNSLVRGKATLDDTQSG